MYNYNKCFNFFKEPARVLRETLRNGLSLKDRLSIKLENDMRYGEARFDHWLLHGKVKSQWVFFYLYINIIIRKSNKGNSKGNSNSRLLIYQRL